MSRYGVTYTVSRLLLGCSFNLINKRCYHRQVKTFIKILPEDDGCYFKRFQYLKGELVMGVSSNFWNMMYYLAYIVNDQKLAVCWDAGGEDVRIISKTGIGDVETTPEEIACGFCWDWGDNQLFLDYDDKTIWSDELNIKTNTNSTWELFKIVLEKYKDADIGHILDIKNDNV